MSVICVGLAEGKHYKKFYCLEGKLPSFQASSFSLVRSSNKVLATTKSGEVNLRPKRVSEPWNYSLTAKAWS